MAQMNEGIAWPSELSQILTVSNYEDFRDHIRNKWGDHVRGAPRKIVDNLGNCKRTDLDCDVIVFDGRLFNSDTTYTFNLFAKLRVELREQCPVIVLCTQSEEADRWSAYRDGAHVVTTTRFDADDVRARVQAAKRDRLQASEWANLRASIKIEKGEMRHKRLTIAITLLATVLGAISGRTFWNFFVFNKDSEWTAQLQFKKGDDNKDADFAMRIVLANESLVPKTRIVIAGIPSSIHLYTDDGFEVESGYQFGHLALDPLRANFVIKVHDLPSFQASPLNRQIILRDARGDLRTLNLPQDLQAAVDRTVFPTHPTGP